MNFLLRSWQEKDAVSLARYADDPEIAKNLRDVFPSPYTRKDAKEYIQICIAKEGKKQICRAIEIDGLAVGSIGLFQGNDIYRKSAELGYWLGRDFWGNQIMTRAVQMICAEGFQILGLVRIYAEPFAGNSGSRRVLEKSGFHLEGVLRNSVYKNGNLLDSCIYARLA